MAKKIRIVLTLQLPAGKATPAPPVGTALGPHGINIVEFTKAYNEKTADKSGQIIPAQITIFEDRSFTLRPQDAAGAGPPAQGRGDRQGLGDRRARDGRPGHPRPGPPDRRDQDARPQCQRHRGRHEGHRGHRPQHGHRGGRLASRPRARERPRPGAPPQGAGPRTEGARTWHTASATRTPRSSSTATALYPLDEAVALARETSNTKFDASVEAHLRLGVDPRHADQMVRGTVVLPHGTGKVVRVAVFAQGEKAQEALRAGADEVGAEDLVKKIEAGWLEFDVALAAPDVMGHGRPPRPDPRPPRPDAEPQVRHDHVRPRPRDPRGQVAAASSSRSTRARSSTSRSARRASSRTSWPRTSPAWSMRSTAPSRPAPRAVPADADDRHDDGPRRPRRHPRGPRRRASVTGIPSDAAQPVRLQGGVRAPQRAHFERARARSEAPTQQTGRISGTHDETDRRRQPAPAGRVTGREAGTSPGA